VHALGDVTAVVRSGAGRVVLHLHDPVRQEAVSHLGGSMLCLPVDASCADALTHVGRLIAREGTAAQRRALGPTWMDHLRMCELGASRPTEYELRRAELTPMLSCFGRATTLAEATRCASQVPPGSGRSYWFPPP